ncbi:MAG: ABC transporter substrate-binding protein [Propionibacteriaceae bacterium]|nr:ABC transporter substrate-binding protein [Propionibacteriaceae bacterium]
MAFRKTAIGLFTVGLAATTLLSGCGRTTDNSGGTSPSPNAAANIIVGTTDKLTTLDPAGSYDHGSLSVEIQVYSFLYGFVPGQNTPQPDAAQSCSFVQPTVFECKMREGLKFANGHDLTSSDVKFTFDRVMKIADPNGPSSLLANLDSVDAPDPLTVDFNLKAANDQTFTQVLATSAGPIVDEEVFPADAVMPDEAIVAANAFSGPYTITSYTKNDTVEFTPYADYVGAQPKAVNASVTQKTFTDNTNLKLSISNGDIDVAYRSLTPTDIQALQSDSSVKVWSAKGGEIRYIVFNMNTMPGDTDAQKFAIRQAMAASVDRDALSTQVYKGQYTPLCSYVPDGYVGANTAVCDEYGTAPDKDKAAKFLADAGVTTPVALNIQYNSDHYGNSSDQEYGLVKQQLEATGLFTVNLQSTEWVTYNKERVADAYPIYQLGWFPDFPDADNYLTPFFMTNNFIGNHFSQPDIDQAIQQEVTETDPAMRAQQIQDIQTTLAQQYLPTLPLLQGSQWAFSRTNISGIVLGVDENLHFSTIGKS